MSIAFLPSKKFLQRLYITNIRHNIQTHRQTIAEIHIKTHIHTGSLMIVVVLVSRRLRINPDNVATPIAASLGDLTTISLLAIICQYLFLTLG